MRAARLARRFSRSSLVSNSPFRFVIYLIGRGGRPAGFDIRGARKGNFCLLLFLLLAFVSVFFMGREYLTTNLHAIANSVNRL